MEILLIISELNHSQLLDCEAERITQESILAFDIAKCISITMKEKGEKEFPSKDFLHVRPRFVVN